MHFNLSHLLAQEEVLVHANLQTYPLTTHTLATRRQAGQRPDLLHGQAADTLTHFIEGLEMPASRAALVYLTQPAVVDGQPTRQLVSMKIALPKAGVAAARAHREAELLASAEDDGTVPADFEPSALPAEFAGVPKGAVNQLYIDTAVALLFHHPHLLNLNEDGHAVAAADIIALITRAINYDSLLLPRTIQELKAEWRTSVPVLDEEQPDGSRPQMTEPGLHPGDPDVPLFMDELHPRVRVALEAPLKYALKKVQDMPSLRGQQWTVQPGLVSTTQPAPRTPEGEVLLRAAAGNDPYRWKLNNLTPSPGLVVSEALSFEPISSEDEKSWTCFGEWSADPQAATQPLTAELAERFIQGKLQVVVTSTAQPQAIFRLPLGPSTQKGEPGEVIRVADKAYKLPDGQLIVFTSHFILNAQHTRITYKLEGENLEQDAAHQVLATLHEVNEDDTTREVYDLHLLHHGHYDGVLHVTCTNYWLRHLAAYAQFENSNGDTIKPDYWPDYLESKQLNIWFQPNAAKKFIGVLPPVNMLCGIPMEAEHVKLRIIVPKGAKTIRLLCGGLGTGDYDGDTCPAGIVLTAALEMALPVALLVAGAASGTTHDVNSLMNDKKVILSILAVGGALATKRTIDETKRLGNSSIPLTQLANAVGPLLLKTGLKQYMMAKMTQGAANRAIPFVNLAFLVFGAITTASNLLRTTVHVLQSPFYHVTEISRSIDVVVELTPDPLYKMFPPQARHYRVLLAYDTAATTVIMEGKLEDKAVLSDPIYLTFKDIAAGGNLKVTVLLYAANGWQAGQGASRWLLAEGDEHATLHISNVQVFNNAPPLTPTSVYTHQGKLAYRGSKHVWLSGADQAPTATPATTPDTHHQVLRWESITLAQAPAALGYCWQATGLNQPRDTDPAGLPVSEAMYTVQSISILEDPELGYAIPQVGYGQLPGLVYDLRTNDSGEGSNFFIEGKPSGEFHLRKLRPAYDLERRRVVPPVFPAPGTAESWGCFPKQLDRYVVHPQGRLIGISTTDSKLFICQLPTAGQPDELAPKASLASGEGTREGLMKNPIALAVGLDGAVLVLEGSRVQAFDLHGNPVPYFQDPDHAGQKTSILQLAGPAGTQYLDLAVEGKGYLYVLARRGTNSPLEDYRLRIYTPAGELLASTPRMVASRLTVGLNRNVYTLNYEVFEGHKGRTEPSVSLWVLSPPNVPTATTAVS